MTDAYKNKIRLRIEKLLGPKRQLDITSCEFMKDLGEALQEEFKYEMQRVIRIREVQQANRDRLARQVKEEEPKKPFFREDSDEEWKPNYSEESDEESSSEDQTGQSIFEEVISSGAENEFTMKDEQTERGSSMASDSRLEFTMRTPGIGQREEPSTEESVDLKEAQEKTPESKTEEAPEKNIDAQQQLKKVEDTEASEERDEVKKGKTGVFAHEEVFKKYRPGIFDEMESCKSIEALYSLCETVLSSSTQDKTEEDVALRESFRKFSRAF